MKDTLKVSELYYSLQGEGSTTGVPCVFLRLQGCVLDCEWCDTKEVWKRGDRMKVDNIVEMIWDVIPFDLPYPKTLVVTGGSPLLQQRALYSLFEKLPGWTIEMENECVIEPTLTTSLYVHIWNNSPKLSNSGVAKEKRYKPAVIQLMSWMNNSWFKFVIDKEEDWQEIEIDFIKQGLIRRQQIILMPQAQSREELLKKQTMVAHLALKKGVRYSTREHIMLWDKKTGV